jgi:CRP-like cAMP-binding protein
VFVGVVILEGKVRSSRPTSGYRRLPRRERIALRRFARPAAVSAGEPILRQDAAADGFYLVVRGRARVTRDDRVVGDLGAGDFFGEIALLERGRRTASVVASTDLSVRVIPRRDFLAAMRYLPTLAERVRNVARERIATPQTLPSPGL